MLPARIPGVFRFALIFSAIFLAHIPLLWLPYYWDEAGYYIPAARDFFLYHTLLPVSTATTSHTPLLSLYLSLWWTVSGYVPITTRTAMLLIAALALAAVYRLALAVANHAVAMATLVCTALYPVWFVQSSLAHADLLAAALTLWGLVFYFESAQASTVQVFADEKDLTKSRQRRWTAAAFFCLAGLAKETSFVTPASLAAWELFSSRGKRWKDCLLLLSPALPLALWFGYEHLRTGFFLGDADYLRYNAPALNPTRLLVASAQRLWHLFGHMNMFMLTAAMAAAMTCPPRKSADGNERPRIAIPIQLAMLAVLVGHLALYSLLGGALLTRYLLPAFPLVILIGMSTLWRRIAGWQFAVVLVAAFFVNGLFFNPPYRFAMEDNLAYRDFILLHKDAARGIQMRFPHAQVLTAWPATDELSRRWLGYVNTKVTVVPIDNFSQDQLAVAAQKPERYDYALFFNTKYVPPHPLFSGLRFWETAHQRFFDSHVDLPPELAAHLLGGQIIWQEQRNGQWIAIAQFPRNENARDETPDISTADVSRPGRDATVIAQQFIAGGTKKR